MVDRDGVGVGFLRFVHTGKIQEHVREPLIIRAQLLFGHLDRLLFVFDGLGIFALLKQLDGLGVYVRVSVLLSAIGCSDGCEEQCREGQGKKCLHAVASYTGNVPADSRCRNSV